MCFGVVCGRVLWRVCERDSRVGRGGQYYWVMTIVMFGSGRKGSDSG